MKHLIFQSRFLILLLGFLTLGISQAWGADKTLTFSLTSNPGSWPTANSTTLTNYTYTLDDVDYTFGLKNVKCNSGYLMLTSTAVLGLPAIENYKLTKVVAKNSSGCSTTTKIGISSSSSSASYISGGAIQTWSTQSSTYTYNLSGTSNNTVYYLYVTNKNAQVTELTLTYEGGAVASTTVTFDAGSNGTLSCPSCTEGNKLTEESAGAGVTLPECTANEGWKFLGWATTSGATTPGTNMTAGQTYKPSKDETLYAVYIQQFDVKWYVNGDLKKTDTYDKGANLHLPEGVTPVSTDCDNYKIFVGWRGNTLDQPTDIEPTGIFTAASGTVTASATYHAVFALKDGEDDEYVRVTQLSEFKDGMSVVLVNNKYSTAFTHTTTASPSLSYTTAPTESSSKITATDAMKWTLVKSDTKWLIKYGDKSVGASTLPSNSSGNKSKTISFTTSNSTWTIAASSYGTNNFYFSNGTTSALEASSSTANWVVYYSTAANMPGSEYYATKVYKSTVSYSQYSTSCVAASVEKPTITTTAAQEQDVYWGTVPVTLACETSGAEIYYTTDGNEPTKASTKYTGLFNITATTTIKAKAFVGSDESYTATQIFTVGRTYADANAYLADKADIADGEKVRITNLRVVITSFSGNRNNVYFADNTNFYTGTAPDNSWAVNGILTAQNKIFTAKVFSGPSYQLRLSSWSDLTYVTLSSITVKNAETTYTDGDKFNPKGLVITKTYSDNTTEDFAYAGNESAFSFNPSLTTNLRPTNTSVTITFQGKSCNLGITVNPIPVTGVTLDKTSAALFVGQTLQLNATVAPDNATTKTVSWSSSSDVATVSNNGLVTAAKAGSATITVTTTDQSKTATCAVNAYSVNITKVGDEGNASNIATFTPANSQVVIGKATHFQFVSINVEGATCTGSSPYTLSNPTDNVVVTVTWKEDDKVHVYFSDAIHDNNSNYMEYVGDPIEFPTINDKTRQAPTGDCVADHYHFVGWTKDASNPNDLVTPASETAPTTDITYHAVWAKEL